MTDVDLRKLLIDAGAHPLEVSRAEAEGPGALRAYAFERLMFPGERRTPVDVWESTGFDPDFGRALWRAMGFAAIPDDTPALTDADLDALGHLQQLLELGIDEDQVLRMTRLIGQAMARISDALISQFRDALAAEPPDAAATDVDALIPLGGLALGPALDAEVTYLLHRHLVDAVRRQLQTAEDGTPTRIIAVGFADLVDFTEVSQRIDEGELQALVDGFESTTSAIVTGVDGQVVKLIGDAVLFTTDDPAAAVDVALALTDAFSDRNVPDVRVGVAYGPVLVHQGDVFGPVVNLASRAVNVATPGSVLVDEATAEALGDAVDLRVSPIRSRNLKGIGRTKLYRVRHSTGIKR
ncbi:MAG TPA: adenylate/guanylate cyclase domain-containing protein [Acidimicrobiales bacterium]|nr:adenylate/guanylate cyclase domain-containing protein [Acidimicrobiales bacterium]